MRYLGLLALAASTTASADPTSGVDSALFRSSYDTGGLFSVEGARLAPPGDISFKLLATYGHTPLKLNLPGIGDGSSDRVLDYLVTLDLAVSMVLSDRIEFAMDVAGYRTATGSGYGKRGRYEAGGILARPSTGLIALRPLSNLDPSASPSDGSSYLGDELAGPLDARFGIKIALLRGTNVAISAVGSVFLPFGDDDMMLGDAGIVYEPKLAIDWRPDRVHATRLVGNIAARFRQRTVLQSYDSMSTTSTPADAKAVLDVGSEVVIGGGGALELSPRLVAAVEGQLFLPLPDRFAIGDCTLYSGASCNTLTSANYFTGAKHGDTTALITGGITAQLSTDVTANLVVGTSLIGARGEDVRVTTGVVWAPQPYGTGAESGRADRDGDGIPDAIDACPDEPEDKDGFQDEDGCPDPDNDGDGIPDSADKCPNEPEDKDGFQDEDGCPDDDNDGDGIPDKLDKCPNDPETFNGFEDEDGCPDVRGTGGPEERADRIDLKGQPVTFNRAALSAPAKQLLTQVAAMVKSRRLTVRIEVHVALGTKSANPAQIAAQKKRDKVVAQQRAKAIADFMATQGMTSPQVQAVGIGSDRPLGTGSPSDPVNERVEFIKAQQGGTP